MNKTLLLAVTALAATPATAQQVPVLNGGSVADAAGVLSTQQNQQLQGQLAAMAGTVRMVVATVPTLGAESPEEAGQRLYNAFNLDGEDQRGVLLLLATQQRKIRMQVGAGVRGNLTDAEAKRINQQVLAPALRGGDYYGGLSSAAQAVGQVVAGQPVAAAGVTAGGGGAWGKWLASVLGGTLLAGLGLTFAVRARAARRRLEQARLQKRRRDEEDRAHNARQQARREAAAAEEERLRALRNTAAPKLGLVAGGRSAPAPAKQPDLTKGAPSKPVDKRGGRSGSRYYSDVDADFDGLGTAAGYLAGQGSPAPSPAPSYSGRGGGSTDSYSSPSPAPSRSYSSPSPSPSPSYDSSPSPSPSYDSSSSSGGSTDSW